MLVEFSVGNFLSIRDRVTLDLRAAGISEFPENKFAVKKGQELLKGAVIYGANSSGKSNLLLAMGTMKEIIYGSAHKTSTDEIPTAPFLLEEGMENEPSHFEIVFWLAGYRYRYGFEVTEQEVRAEWLFRTRANEETILFVREGEIIQLGNVFKEGERLESKTRPNGLFLTTVDQFNGEIAKSIMKWLSRLNVISGLEHDAYRGVTASVLENPDQRNRLMTLLTELDLGFDEVQVKKRDFDPAALPSSMPDDMRKEVLSRMEGKKIMDFMTRHTRYGKDGSVLDHLYFDLDTQESSGTNTLFDLIGPFFDTLLRGGILVVDELNAKLHPLLTKALVGLFMSDQTNDKNAQLIFATHDTNLLSYGRFRRDQIYFTEKDRRGATDLYSLVEYKLKDKGGKVRKDQSFENDYIQGRYGGIPYFGNLTELFAQWQNEERSTTRS